MERTVGRSSHPPRTRPANNHVQATPAAARAHRSRASQTATRRRPAPVAEGCSVAPVTADAGRFAASAAPVAPATPAASLRRPITNKARRLNVAAPARRASAAPRATAAAHNPANTPGGASAVCAWSGQPRRGGSSITDLRPRGAELGRGLGADARHKTTPATPRATPQTTHTQHLPRHPPRHKPHAARPRRKIAPGKGRAADAITSAPPSRSSRFSRWNLSLTA